MVDLTQTCIGQAWQRDEVATSDKLASDAYCDNFQNLIHNAPKVFSVDKDRFKLEDMITISSPDSGKISRNRIDEFINFSTQKKSRSDDVANYIDVGYGEGNNLCVGTGFLLNSPNSNDVVAIAFPEKFELGQRYAVMVALSRALDLLNMPAKPRSFALGCGIRYKKLAAVLAKQDWEIQENFWKSTVLAAYKGSSAEPVLLIPKGSTVRELELRFNSETADGAHERHFAKVVNDIIESIADEQRKDENFSGEKTPLLSQCTGSIFKDQT